MPRITTTIRVSSKTWEYLHQHKDREESIDKTLQRLLDIEDWEPTSEEENGT